MKNPKNPVNNDIMHDDLSLFGESEAVCASEYTGLIPSAPQDDYELDSYNDILEYSPESINIYNHKRD